MTDSPSASERPASTRRQRVQSVVSEVLTSVGFLALLGMVFGLTPTTGRESAWTVIVAACVALIAFTVLYSWQLRRVRRSPYPLVSVVAALATIVGAFVMLFSEIYLSIQQLDPNAFNETLSRLSAAYFTVTVLATVGFGDIVARTDPARAVVMVQMVLGLGLVGSTVRVLTSAARAAKQGRDGDG